MRTLDVVGSDGRYLIREDGVLFRTYVNGKEPKVVKGFLDNNGYRYVNISKKKGEPRQVAIHRLVAEAFVKNSENKPHVDHIDENKGNNHANNLRWVTPAENSEFYSKNNATNGRAVYIKNLKDKAVEDRRRFLNADAELRMTMQTMSGMVKELKGLITEAKQMEIKTRSYEGYLDTSGTKFSDIEDMVNKTGKVVFVNGERFDSAGAAARYIFNDCGRSNVKDISRRIRKFLGDTGKTKCVIYEKYDIQ